MHIGVIILRVATITFVLIEPCFKCHRVIWGAAFWSLEKTDVWLQSRGYTFFSTQALYLLFTFNKNVPYRVWHDEVWSQLLLPTFP